MKCHRKTRGKECLGLLKIVFVDGEPEDVESFWTMTCNKCQMTHMLDNAEITRNLQALVDDNRWYYSGE